MIKNYIKIAWRNLWKNKLYSAINIGGLTVGIAICLLALLFVDYEIGFDRFHQKNIYRLCTTQEQEGVATAQQFPQSMFPMGPTLQAEFPEITAYVRIIDSEQLPLRLPEANRPDTWASTYSVDASFLTTFDFKLLNGDPASALEKPGSIVLTEKLAKQLFGTKSPLGELVRHDGSYYADPDTTDYVVTGILQDIPHQSHLQFDALVSLSTLEMPGLMENWSGNWVYTYLQLEGGTDVTALETKFPAYLQKYMGVDKASRHGLLLQPLSDLHLRSAAISRDALNAQKFNNIYLVLLVAVAFFVLALAIINYVNLTTARSLMRAKEVGVRKTNGAGRLQIAVQFLGETLVFSLLALGGAFVLVQLALPVVNEFSQRNLQFNVIKEPRWLLIGGAIAIVSGFLAGFFPAVLMARIRPAAVLKGRWWTSYRSPLRNALVITQFTIAIGLSMATLLAFQQLQFIQHYDVGFNKDEVMVARVRPIQGARNRIETLMGKFREIPGVSEVTGALRRLGNDVDQNGLVFHDAGAAPQQLASATMFVDYNYIPFYDVQLLAGRNLSPEFGQDRLGDAYIINETLARKLLEHTPNPQASLESLIGESLRYQWKDTLGSIVGIVRDFNFSSLHHSIEPLCLTYQYEYYFRELSIRVDRSRLNTVLPQIERHWNDLLPNQQLEYYFLDEQLDQLYKTDTVVGTLMAALAVLAIVISCMGLIGLAVYSTERRAKEIGIRKVLGATVSAITVLLASDFVKLVLVAIAIATPIAWWAMNRWLGDFAYRIDIQWWMFAVAGLAAVVIALLTVSFQAIKAAVANPVESLRDE